VLDYKRLTLEEIQLVVSWSKQHIDQNSFAKFERNMEGVDGRLVADEERLMNPWAENRPAVAEPGERRTINTPENGSVVRTRT
jgi:hypothetical protein